MTRVRHPIFARFYTRFSPIADERMGIAEHRAELLHGVKGRVVEVGAGNGRNFAHYPAGVAEVLAVEPEPYMRARSIEAARGVEIPVSVVDGTADRLPLADASVDVGVCSLVLCSVANQIRALAELRRVIRPGGELRFYEHLRYEDEARARWQDRVDAIWPRFGGGCRTARETVGAIERAGFAMERIRRFDFRPSAISWFIAPHAIGIARRV